VPPRTRGPGRTALQLRRHEPVQVDRAGRGSEGPSDRAERPLDHQPLRGYRSTSLLTNPTERRAITVSGAGLGRGTPIGGGHRPGGELYPYASTSVTDGGTVSKPS
jgi:hypothetical protein